MNLTDEHLQLLQHAEEEGARLAGTGAGHGSGVNRSLVQALGESGLLGRILGSGSDVTAVDLCLIRQGLARTNTEAETTLAVQGLGSHPILKAASAEVRDAWIPKVVSGEAVAGFALTEPDAGSDAASLALRADSDGDGYRLSGEKIYISHAPDADIYTVFARTGDLPGSKGVSAFAVPGDSPGLSGESLNLIGNHAIGSLGFDGVFVPRSHLLGEVGGGFGVAMRTLDLFRPSVGAFAVGMAESALRLAVTHAAGREAFGKPIVEFQSISHKLADMTTQIEAAKLLVYAAADAYDRGRRVTGMAAMAKVFATEMASFVVDAAIQIHGARGLEASHPLAHLYLEVRAPRIYEGTSEIQRTLIARELAAGRLGPDAVSQHRSS